MQCYTPGIYAEGYKVLISLFVQFVSSFVTFCHVTSKFFVNVSPSNYISPIS